MKRITTLVIAFITLAWLAGCGPTVSVSNKTGFAVRAIVISAGARSVLSPSPGESSTAEVQEGPYKVVVIPDAEWLDYAKLKRKVLNDALANSDSLSGQQLLSVVAQLKDIAAKMQAFEQAAGSGASCGGRVSEDGGGLAEVSQAADGKLVVVCK